jgi:hypothetical protein
MSTKFALRCLERGVYSSCLRMMQEGSRLGSARSRTRYDQKFVILASHMQRLVFQPLEEWTANKHYIVGTLLDRAIAS